MSTIKSVIVVALFLSMGLYVYSQQDMSSGYGFYSGWKGTQKAMNGLQTTPLEKWAGGFYDGFVAGTKSALESFGLIDIPAGVTNGQILMVVGKYLDDHPELLHLTPHELTKQALILAFPKR